MSDLIQPAPDSVDRTVIQIHDSARGIRMMVIPNIRPKLVHANIVMVTTIFHCKGCGGLGRAQTLQLCCN